MQDRNSLEAYCLGKPGVTKSYPFDATTAVFKVGDKMFMLYNDDEKPLSFNVKCDPLYALELRSLYDGVNAGYHMNKKHWNTVEVDGSIEDEVLLEFIDDSYALVYKGLTKKEKAKIDLTV